jgi:hypothetical protein
LISGVDNGTIEPVKPRYTILSQKTSFEQVPVIVVDNSEPVASSHDATVNKR